MISLNLKEGAGNRLVGNVPKNFKCILNLGGRLINAEVKEIKEDYITFKELKHE